MEADFFCQECKAFTQTVLDRSTGDTVCTECALVVDHHYVDLTSEWRTFADDTDGEDKVRVGGASNPLLGDEGGLAPTLISKTNGKPPLFSVARAQAHDPHRALLQAFGTVSAMASRLHLVSKIEHRAQEIYKNLKDRKSIVGKPQTAVLAACLFVACRLEHAPRTVNEIFSVANGATKKKIGQAINIIEAEMGSTLEIGTARAGDFMRRFCSHLGMSNQTVKAALEAVQNTEELDIRRAPLSVAAAVIYMITQLSDEKKQLRDISGATGVAEGTIKKAYKDLHPHAAKLIPASFAPEEDLRKLATP